MNPEIWNAINKWGDFLNVDKNLIAAIVATESNFEPHAMRYEETWRYLHFPEQHAIPLNITALTERKLQMFSYGLMQVMGSVAREMGMVSPLPKMLEIDTGIQYGTMQIRRMLLRWPSKIQHAISAYNQGSPIFDQAAQKYKNQGYVDKVMSYYSKCLFSSKTKGK